MPRRWPCDESRIPLDRSLKHLRGVRELMNFKPFDLDRKRARLAGAHSIGDLRAIARRRTPTPAFQYVDGGSFEEDALRRNRAAYTALEFVPGVLRDVSRIDTSTTIAGRSYALPVGIAPTGLTRLMNAEGETAGVRAAAAARIPFALSTMGTVSIEDVAAAAPDAGRWFQLYLRKDREASMELVRRAARSGYDTLLVTVDTPVGGARNRDLRNGMTLPPTLTAKTLLDASYRPGWWIDFLTTAPLSFANFDSDGGNPTAQFNTMFDASLDFSDIGWLREQWPGTLVIKGVQGPADALACFEAGADGIVVSNHGGRQLDRAPVPLHQLPAIREAVGPAKLVIADSGILGGGDIVANLAAGADFTLIGRAYLYGLMAGGQAGVTRALQILESEMRIVMALLGVDSVAGLNLGHVRLNPVVPAPVG